MAVDDQLLLFNGDGNDYPARLTKAGKAAEVCIIDSQRGIPAPALHITLAQAISRSDRMDLSIQKAVELGVSRIQPLVTEKSAVRKVSQAKRKMEHWQAVIISACEQSGRSEIPALPGPLTLKDWLHSVNDSGTTWVLEPEANIPIGRIERPEFPLHILTGPEGGLTVNELTQCTSHRCHYITMGQRILRTETAGLAALGIAHARWGDLNQAR